MGEKKGKFSVFLEQMWMRLRSISDTETQRGVKRKTGVWVGWWVQGERLPTVLCQGGRR